MTDMILPPAAPTEEQQPEPAAWTPDDYWAAAPREELGALMKERWDASTDELEASGRLDKIRRSVRTYYGADPESGGDSAYVRLGGAQGEKVHVNVNHYRSLMNQAHVLVTSSRPAVSAQANDSTYGPTEDTILATQILDHDLAHKRLEDALTRVDLTAFMQGEGWLLQIWDPLAGKPLAVGPDGKPLYEGDILDIPLGPLDVARDTGRALTPVQDHEWIIVRRPMNRWRLLKQYPDYAECIRGLPSVTEGGQDNGSDQQLLTQRGKRTSAKSDLVWVRELYHAKTYALPEGRYALMLSAEDVPIATPLPYDTIPGHCMPADYEEESAWGTTPMFDWLSLQALYNAAFCVLTSNHENHGDQATWCKPGDVPSVDKVEGHEFIVSENKPEPIERLAISGESFTYIDLLQRGIETLSALGTVGRGDPDEAGASGAKLAFLDAMATRTYSVASREWAKFQERVFNARLNIYKLFATAPRLIRIAGEDDSAAVKHFTGDKIKVAQVTVRIGNPAASTIEGRKQLADEWADREWITTPEQHVQVITTGRADPLFQRQRNEMRLLKLTVQRLRELATRLPEPPRRGTMAPGEPMQDPVTGAMVPGPPVDAFDQWRATAVPPNGGVPIALTQKHLLAISELSGHLNSPEALMDERFAACVMAAVQGHIDMRTQLVQTMPWLCEAVGEPLLPSEQMAAQAAMAPPMPPPGAPPPDGTPVGPPPGEGAESDPMRAQVQGIEGGPVDPASLPFMPRMPDTGEPAQVAGAGGIV